MENYKFVTARFINNEKTTVEIQWEAEDGDIVIEITEAEDDNQTWVDLLKRITLDDIHENTIRYMREQRQLFEDTIKSIAQKEGLTVQNLEQDDIYDVIIKILNDDVDTESLFKFKLKLFDLESVKTCTDRVLKAELRKSKSMGEAIGVFSKI